MTLDDFLTLTLPQRIECLRRRAGSHDKLAAELGTTRQTVIGWEKDAQPGPGYRDKLAALSGFPPETFTRSTAEREVREWTATRLEELGETVAAAGARLVSMKAELDAARTRLDDLEAWRASTPARSTGRGKAR